jgi:hypothetical protein
MNGMHLAYWGTFMFYHYKYLCHLSTQQSDTDIYKEISELQAYKFDVSQKSISSTPTGYSKSQKSRTLSACSELVIEQI